MSSENNPDLTLSSPTISDLKTGQIEAGHDDEHPFEMSVSLNVLNHLGLNLYSNVPAVLSEVVANAWDADAKLVEIDINKENGRIVITDDGHGMTVEDVNEKFLHVGYRRRDIEEFRKTPDLKRAVMGRKGIGKLSLLSIADKVSIFTTKDGTKSGFDLELKEIKRQISENAGGKYYPPPIDEAQIEIEKGTKIVLTSLRKKLHQAIPALRRRLARRFSIIGAANNFIVKVNGQEISVKDRDYYHKVEYAWFYDDDGSYADQITGAKETSTREAELMYPYENLETGTEEVEVVSIRGWIGTVEKPSNLKDVGDENLNRIVLIVRGKLAQEDILSDFSEGGIFASYIIGELEADFLDFDDKDDAATSNRQRLIEDDPRYIALSEFVYKELKNIQNKWTELRNNRGIVEALEIPSINEWYALMGAGEKKKAQSLFGKIKTLTVEAPEERARLYKFCVLAFESFRFKGNLDALEQVSGDNLADLLPLFETIDDLEATLYRQIVQQRIGIIKALSEKVDDDAKEKILQQYLFDHLWLLDPSWERATGNPQIEKNLTNMFEENDAKLSEEEKQGRVDIKYRTASGKHIIVELKRAGRPIDSTDLLKQVKKYRNGARKILEAAGKANEPIEVVCVLGKNPTDWTDERTRAESEESLKPVNARIVLYDELISGAYDSYKEFLRGSEKAGTVTALIERIEKEVIDSVAALPAVAAAVAIPAMPAASAPIALPAMAEDLVEIEVEPILTEEDGG